jgi:hypothetical protein
MTTYKEIFGKPIKVLSSDPTDAGAAGQVWYNSTLGSFRSVLASGAWSSASSTINAKQRPGGCGTQTAGLAAGGFTAPGPTLTALATTEEYNGSGWSSGGNLNTARGNVGLAGTQTAAVFSGQGSPSTPYAGTTELYDGTSWTTSPNSANDAVNYRSNCGVQTAALFSGGNIPGTNRSNANEEFNGTSFSEGGDLPQKQSSQGQAGTQTAAINSFGSTNSPVPGNTGDGDNAISLEYDGTSWTVGPNGRGVVPLSGFAMGSGTQTDALFAGAPSTNSCKYDGTTFTVGPALAVAQDSSAHGSSSASATWIAHGSPVPSVGTNTQEFNFSTNIITAAAWSSGGALSTGRESMSSAGTQTAALAVGGHVGPPGGTTAVESYNGTAMSGAPSLNTARQYAGGCGTQTAAITYANFPVSGATEEYDGSSWATQPNSMATARRSFASFGIQTAALAAGGTTGPAVSSLTEEYNGTSWTAGGALSQARQYFAGAGIETSGLVFGGSDNPNSTKYTNTEEYGGTSWTAGGALPTGTSSLMGCGATQTAALAFGGYQPSKVATTVGYDGTAWSTRPSMGGATAEGSGAGTNVAALSIGGSPAETGVEEFTSDTTSLNYKTVSSS